MVGCIDKEVQAAVVGSHKSDDVQQAHRAEAGQKSKCQNDSTQDQSPVSAETSDTFESLQQASHCRVSAAHQTHLIFPFSVQHSSPLCSL